MNSRLSVSECEQVADILSRRANEIAQHYDKHRSTLPASVDHALDREIVRLRKLADKLRPAVQEDAE